MSMLLRHLGQFMQRRSLATRLIVLILVVSILAITTLFYDLSRQNQREIETLQTNNLVNAAQELARNLDATVRRGNEPRTHAHSSRNTSAAASMPPPVGTATPKRRSTASSAARVESTASRRAL